VHVLLTKADKLTRNQAHAALAAARRELGATAGVQLFSSTAKTGVNEARDVLVQYLKEKNPAAEGPPPGETDPA
jgi:GTP-binding protein